MTDGSSRRRLALFGGTFNPIHLGHVRAAEIVLDRFRLDRILFVPSAVPPHKETREVAAARHRLRMVRLALEGFPRFEVSTIEIEGPAPSYSIRTLDRIRESLPPRSEIFFILGIDAFLEIETWKDYRKVLDRCAFIVISRPGFRLQQACAVLRRDIADRITELESDPRSHSDTRFPDYRPSAIYLTPIDALDISSTEIRRRVQSGLSIAGMAAPAVIEYIERNKLYRNDE
jgi:nicotinate-nucleotide adenylyltransferase